MELDMYAFATPETFTAEVDISPELIMLELHHWIGHETLHGWMENLYRAKGGARPEFTGASVCLTLQDIARLEGHVIERAATGIAHDLAFIAKARAALAAGLTVYYEATA